MVVCQGGQRRTEIDVKKGSAFCQHCGFDLSKSLPAVMGLCGRGGWCTEEVFSGENLCQQGSVF